ncbi:unnamed protein product [Chrysodeixis includens]|uniref:Uncharacterized protein n=1 Tax=Chrysodeixis includens TaxID=689277 RepID=A0A9P0BT24_CHRIL|nr:unnamed protein product [Chrysodeixis includens]
MRGLFTAYKSCISLWERLSVLDNTKPIKMVRLTTLFVLVLAIVSCVIAAPGRKHGSSATASHGSIGVGSVSGGKFGGGAFSIGHGGGSQGHGSGGSGGKHSSSNYGR